MAQKSLYPEPERNKPKPHVSAPGPEADVWSRVKDLLAASGNVSDKDLSAEPFRISREGVEILRQVRATQFSLVMEKIPMPLREAVFLHHGNDQDFPEVAKRLKISEKTARTRISQGTHKLWAFLSKDPLFQLVNRVLPMISLVPLEPNSLFASMRVPSLASSLMAEDSRILHVGRDRYYPLPLAAWKAQASESALRHWIDTGIKFGGRPILTHITSTNRLYLSEDSVNRISKRFVAWPSNQPVESVTLGETDDKSGYLGMSDAAKILGISSRTMWLWATENKAPRSKRLDVIQDTTSDYFYVRERDVLALKPLVPRSGLHRGRRPRISPHP